MVRDIQGPVVSTQGRSMGTFLVFSRSCPVNVWFGCMLVATYKVPIINCRFKTNFEWRLSQGDRKQVSHRDVTLCPLFAI